MDERGRIKEELRNELERVKTIKNFVELIPEIGTNIAYALEDAQGNEDVVAIPGRIRIGLDKPVFLDPEFGASKHMACMVISVRKHDPEKKCAINIKYSEKVLDICRKLGLSISSYDRREEPEELKKKEGKTIPWGVEQVIKKEGKIPDIIYHTGDWGKVPSVVVLGRNPREVLDIVSKIGENFT